MNAEQRRLIGRSAKRWRLWGPYLSERQWGTVREDYSADGEVWHASTHEQARSRCYRWGEDGIAGICDEDQYLCFSLAFWNYQDRILKERFFGLSGKEGNHGEDVKELYYYLDSTPSHGYMQMLYKYPQQAFPYEALLAESQRRSRTEPEYELIDTGIFEDNRYFDIYIEYAKKKYDDLLIQVRAINRGAHTAPLDLIPQLWFRNIWSWDTQCSSKPQLQLDRDVHSGVRIIADHHKLGRYFLHAKSCQEVLFCENESNQQKLYGTENTTAHPKDAFHDYIVQGQKDAVSPTPTGTRVALRHSFEVEAGAEVRIQLRLSHEARKIPFKGFDFSMQKAKAGADEFYQDLQKSIEDCELKKIQRQALAGLLWSKQFYFYDVEVWLQGDPNQPTPPNQRLAGRNAEWKHLRNRDVISMPDTWEYPWYAAWDLAFHCLPFGLVDAGFAKEQLILMTREWYMHPNGQLPAYEWTFDDVNPPVHAWAAWRVYQIDKKQRNGQGDTAFLERIFHKMLLNFTWWVNRKDPEGRNVFQGGFLGLDNIGVFDRSSPLPTGGYIRQADGTSWMAMYSLNMMRIALELALSRPVYQDIASKFFEHFLRIAEAMTNIAGEGIGLWDEEDQFYYDVLSLPNGHGVPLKVRSMVGLIPLFAVETIEPETLRRLPEFAKRMEWFLTNRPELAALVSRWNEPGRGDRRLLSLLRGHRLKKILARMLDETEFLSEFGIRGMSKVHESNPYVFTHGANRVEVQYLPAESDSGLFGGNSNWRGPVWFPVNYLIIESLQKFHHYFGDDYTVECPTGSGNYMSILEVSEEISRRLIGLFTHDKKGNRPIYGEETLLQKDPHFKDHILFYEYFHGDTGRGVGASHQTGWTALVAKLIQPRQNQSTQQDLFQQDAERKLREYF